MGWRNLAAVAAASVGLGLGSAPTAIGHSDLMKRRTPQQRTMVSELQRLIASGAVTQSAGATYLSEWQTALATERRLRGTRAAQLIGVTETLHQIAFDGDLTPSRLPAIFLTLERNVQWWTNGSLLSSGQRVQFPGSGLVWEYYPGQGIQLQVLASFAHANALYAAGPPWNPALESLLGELIPLAANRAGGLAWEYYFDFDGGRPPWISAMAQATALQALANAYKATANPTYLQVAAQALPPLAAAPPAGVSISTPGGRRFLQYSFAPQTDIINAFLQALIGLDRYAMISGSTEAQALFAEGNVQAQSELPLFNTGAWSLYQPGLEDDLSYHQLVTGFLTQLCQLTAAPVYCTTASAFQQDLTTPPSMSQLTSSARAGRPFMLRFRLSKTARVGVTLTRGTTQVLATSARFPYGVDAINVPALRGVGNYGVRLSATDLAGNSSHAAGTITVLPKRGRTKGAGAHSSHPPNTGGTTLAGTG
jgi:hypothetical protein